MKLVAQLRGRFGVEPILRVLGIASSTYYGWGQRQADPSPRQRQDEELVAEIVDIHTTSGGTYGSPRVHATLRRRGIRVSRKRVERLMRGHEHRCQSPAGHVPSRSSTLRPLSGDSTASGAPGAPVLTPAKSCEPIFTPRGGGRLVLPERSGRPGGHRCGSQVRGISVQAEWSGRRWAGVVQSVDAPDRKTNRTLVTGTSEP
ncbi:IS3 family transposase [Lentzea xinjiangensis]|uniref:IS3 family transposase n=1 Tax=Lentzea xinjiangensis TaxID=402600 RepID=UPI000AF7AED0